MHATFRIELFSDVSGVKSLGEFTITPPNDVFNFYGYWTADPIRRVTIRETVIRNSYGDLYSDDNEFFGRFMTGTMSNVAELPPSPSPPRRGC